MLDLGAADHRVDAPDDVWLHKHVVAAARECVGVDVDEDRVREMQALGYKAVVADITRSDALAKVAEHGPFDLVVAGEIIEHLSCPGALFSAAAQLLPIGGQFLLTTPNPYAPWRSNAGLVGKVWENVDHVVYLFPSGVAELAERNGFDLTQFGTVNWGQTPDLSPRLLTRWFASACYRRVFNGQKEDRHWLGLPLHVRWVGLLGLSQLPFRLKAGLWREASVYLLEKVVNMVPQQPSP